MPFNKIGTKGITDGSIASAEFADGIVTSAKLQSGAVTNAKLTNTTVSLSGTSITLGDSVTFNNKFVDWQSVIVADGSTGTTGVSGRGYFINTTSAAHTFTLPSSATRGDNISIKDYAGTFATYNLTIARNGHNIQGVANNSLISTNRASVVLVYVDVTRGWEFVEESNVANLGQALFITATGGTITTSGNFKIHSFTGDGCFVVSQVGNIPVAPTGGPSTVDYLVVAGGGGAGYQVSSTPPIGLIYGGAGGGGAGGFREGRQCVPAYTASPLAAPTGLSVSVTTYPVTVGAGGTAGSPSPEFGSNGSSSIFSTITSAGGGGGGPTYAGAGRSGGSGGGGAGKTDGGGILPGTRYAGGAGNTPPTSPSQGNSGGDGGPAGGPAFVPVFSGGGGGGATVAGGPGEAGASGTGGNGGTTSISGSPTTYAGGGGSNKGGTLTGPIAGGSGGGGEGNCTGASGTANTGGGGGAGKSAPNNGTVRSSGAGGKGIVVIRYKFQ